ncbi:hypothetical protein CCR75_008702 [Bremia lactucae]|uniref:Uncharacterized protein n=1 Tax=Bremia lactucae TaxID=4779 RepID=A0A976FMB4_BRELC|nr:hypothetical protein CCR75_008702 [Bremia lactucae]
MDPVHATAGSYGSQRVEETQESRDVASASTEQVEKGTSLGFRKFREALMAKKFKNQDNLPVAIEAVAGLYIGSYGAATNLQALQQAGITHVLCVSQRLSLK